MKILITGICGFVGSSLARALQNQPWPGEALSLVGVDSFSRPGSELNRRELKREGVKLFHGDLRVATDVDGLPACDWVIDAAANPSVLGGVDGKSSSRQMLDHNLGSTINLLEYCKRHRAGFSLLSTSRVYSIPPLAALPMVEANGSFKLDDAQPLPAGVSARGLTEQFSTTPPISLYGATKVASELLALEYGETFRFPVWINRCGVMAGAGQFGRPDQGIISYWIHSWARRRPLKYIGFGGRGLQARDVIHPSDLAPLLRRQFAHQGPQPARVMNFGGGVTNTFSLHQLSQWCEQRFGPHAVTADLTPRPFDIPWMVMDSGLAATTWGWSPQTPLESILDEVAQHSTTHPDWLEASADD